MKYQRVFSKKQKYPDNKGWYSIYGVKKQDNNATAIFYIAHKNHLFLIS